MKTLLFAFALLTLVGCASAPAVAPPAALFRATPISDKSTAAQVDTAFYRTLADCQTVLTGLEARSTELKWWSVGLQTAGAIAGSILLPIAAVQNAAQSVMVGLGAFAGFTNTEISVVRNEGLGAADVIRQRASIQGNMQSAIGKFYIARDAEPLDRGKISAALAELKVACVSYWIASPSATPVAVPE